MSFIRFLISIYSSVLPLLWSITNSYWHHTLLKISSHDVHRWCNTWMLFLLCVEISLLEYWPLRGCPSFDCCPNPFNTRTEWSRGPLKAYSKNRLDDICSICTKISNNIAQVHLWDHSTNCHLCHKWFNVCGYLVVFYICTENHFCKIHSTLIILLI